MASPLALSLGQSVIWHGRATQRGSVVCAAELPKDLSKLVGSSHQDANVEGWEFKISPKQTPKKNNNSQPPAHTGGVVVQATKRGRGGKTVTIVSGISKPEDELMELLKHLKNLMACGGALKEGQIEIQGNHSSRITQELCRLGYKAVKAGR